MTGSVHNLAARADTAQTPRLTPDLWAAMQAAGILNEMEPVTLNKGDAVKLAFVVAAEEVDGQTRLRCVGLTPTYDVWTTAQLEWKAKMGDPVMLSHDGKTVAALRWTPNEVADMKRLLSDRDPPA